MKRYYIGGRDRRILYFAGEVNPPPPPRARLRREIGGVRGERKSEDHSAAPVDRSARFASCTSKGKGREFRHETCPSSRAPRASHAPQILFPFLSSTCHAGWFSCCFTPFLPFTIEPGHRLLKMELLSQKYRHK